MADAPFNGLDPTAKPAPTSGANTRPLFSLRPMDIQLYRLSDLLSGFLIFVMLIFSPWAFGTTEAWSIRVMNGIGYTLGLLFLAKLFIRQAKGYRARRWDEPVSRTGSAAQKISRRNRPAQLLGGFTVLILCYCLIGAINAGANYHPEKRAFEYHNYLAWLPHSFDRQRSWFYFWMYLGLAGAFWSVQDWLCGMTPDEENRFRNRDETHSQPRSHALPGRLRALLWLLCLNGTLLGIEGIIQRAAGSDRLLFLVHPQVNPEGVTQFGPYAYRSNAAQYFNLLWPLCLGFWWRLQRSGGLRAGGHHLLLFGAAIMAACPVISSSRGSALTAAAMIVIALGYLIFSALPGLHRRGGSQQTTWLLTLFFAVALGLGWYFGWDTLEPRMEQLGEGYENREAMYAAARPMTADYPWFGTGVGTFATVFQFYRFSNSTYWPEQLHNDWLETRITFGWIGLGLVLAAFACVFLKQFFPGGIKAGRRLIFLGWLALAGCLAQAVFDFPLQIHSILLLFLVVCAMLFNLGGQTSRR